MLAPARFQIAKIVCYSDRERDVTRALHEFGGIQIIDVEKRLTRTEESETERAVYSLLSQASQLVEYLDLSKEKLASGERTQFREENLADVVKECRTRIETIEPPVNKIRSQKALLDQEMDELSVVYGIAEKLLPLEFDFELLGSGDHFYVTAGQMKNVRFSRFKWNLKEVSPESILLEASQGEDMVLVIGVPLDQRETLERLLTSYGFLEYKVPSEISGNVAQVLQHSANRVQEINEELVSLEERKTELAKIHKKDLLSAEEQLRLERERLLARQNYKTEGSIVQLWAWIPENHTNDLQNMLKAADDTTAIEFQDPDFPAEEYPTELENHRLVQPYEALIHSFGTPGYNEWDPSFLVFLTFGLIFGIMFADMVHGALLVLLGTIFLFIKAPEDPQGLGEEMKGYLSNGAEILIACGIFSFIFGILFGSAFGFHGEEVKTMSFFGGEELGIEAIWFVPANEKVPSLYGISGNHANGIFLLLELALLVAIIHLSLGLILNIVNHIRQGHRNHAIFLPGCMLVMYWGAVLLLFSYQTDFPKWFSLDEGTFNIALLGGPALEFTIPAALLISVPFLLLPVGLSFGYFSTHGLEGISEVLDNTLSLLGNTISYARIFALFLVHGILSQIPVILQDNFGLIIFEIATYQDHEHEVHHVGLLGLLIGIIIILTFETMISFLQTLRLHWVEFFLKLNYQGTGKPMQPFKAERNFTVSSSAPTPAT
ncbi:MAG: V-type ATP synthase subunit I [Candidatus Heimdallarchaeota archaeon]